MTWPVFLVLPMVFGLWAQHHVNKTFRRWSEVTDDSGLSGAEVARRILDRNGLREVPIELVAGQLSDHYDPRRRSVHLSEAVYGQRSVAAVAVAAHEVGHAIQHARAYPPMTFRSALWPATAIASSSWIWLLLLGVFLKFSGLILVAVLLYAAVVLFQLVTLPVEFDASRRATLELNQIGLSLGDSVAGRKKVLGAAAMTYIAAALAALSQLLYFVLMMLGGRD